MITDSVELWNRRLFLAHPTDGDKFSPSKDTWDSPRGWFRVQCWAVTHMTRMSEVISPESIFWLLLQICWQIIKCQVHHFVPSTSISRNFVSTLVISLPLIHVLPVWIDDHSSKDVKLCRAAPLLFASSLNAFSGMSFHVVGPRNSLHVRFFPP